MMFDEEKTEVGDLYRLKNSCFIVMDKYNPIEERDVLVYNLYFIKHKEFQGNTKLFKSSVRMMFQDNEVLEVSKCPKRK